MTYCSNALEPDLTSACTFEVPAMGRKVDNSNWGNGSGSRLERKPVGVNIII